MGKKDWLIYKSLTILCCRYHTHTHTHTHTPCKRDPCDVLIEYKTRRHEQLCKLFQLNALFLVSLELDACCRQHINGVLCIHVFTGEGEENVCAGKRIYIMSGISLYLAILI